MAAGVVKKLPVKIKVPGAALGGLSAPKKLPQSQQLAPALSASPLLAPRPAAAAAPPPFPTADQVRAGGGWKDSGWSTAVANIAAQRSRDLSRITSQRGDVQADFEKNRDLTEEGRGKTLGGTRNAANSQGLLYSGILSEREGDVNTDFNRRQETLLDAVNRASRDFDAQEDDVRRTSAAAEWSAEQEAISRYLEMLARQQAAAA